ncbi:hypothetical protein DM77_1168 [Burkholderia mallei]|nr:hypothetical protein DM77_1168 [Burkholderia mallei]KOT20341.1 hypothetical protein DM52_775 [Burkholderia mallei]
MACAVNQRLEPDSLSNVERADALRRVELVTGDRQQIDAERIDVGRDLADRLGRVRVKPDAVLAGDRADILDRLNGAGFVVRMHDRDERGARRDCATDGVGIDAAVAVHGNAGDFSAQSLKELQRLQDCRMFGRLGDHVAACVRRCEYSSFQRKVVRFTAAAREDNFVRCGADQRRDLGARPIQCNLCRHACPMSAGRIAEGFRQQRAHRIRDRRVDGGACVVVEVDMRHVVDLGEKCSLRASEYVSGARA